jgi:hypothetical protein
LDEIQTKIKEGFPPCYSKSTLQLCLEILFLKTHATSCSFFSALLYTVKEKGGKPDRKPHPFQKIHTETSSLKTLKIMPRNPKESGRS